MEFILFDVSATCVFLLGYVTVVSLKRQRAPVSSRREWPRLSAPR